VTVSAQVVYRFNGFRLDPGRRLLFGADGQPIGLKPKVFATLLYLVERPGELVNKEELLAAVWPHVVVEENNLNKAISTLRQVFGETRDSHRFIVTEPGQGYRFVASVEAASEAATEPPPMLAKPAVGASALDPGMESKRPKWVLAAVAIAAAVVAAAGVYWLATPQADPVDSAAPAPPRNSIALLPFVNLSPDPEDAYFAVGLHEEILNQLTKVSDLHVASRTSVQSYAGTQKTTPEIARELNVETVLDGSLRYADGRVLVTTRLNDGASNTTLWSESYDREFSNIFAIQSEIALNVARALKAELLPAERERVTRVPTTSVRAYELYLSATARQFRGTGAELFLAIEEIEQALALDENFALAWMRQSNLRTLAQYYEPERRAEHLARGAQAARTALGLDPSLGLAHAALGRALATKGEWTAAEAAYRKALDLNVPLGDPTGYAMLQLGVADFDYAREIYQESRAIAPHEPTVLLFLVLTNALLGEWSTAVAQYELGVRVFVPWREAEAENLMMHLRVGRNELEEARAIRDLDPINAAMIASLDAPQTALRELRSLYAATEPVNPNRWNAWRDIGLWAGHFGDAALALDAMRSAVTEVGGAQMAYVWLPQLEEMRQLPEFKAFLREIGIVAYWQEYGWPDICRPVGNDDFKCD
jgi:TolB-like protein/DNA-binding winged helix-turn-helix (wHTH) protein